MQLEEQKILEEAGWGYYSKCAAAAAKSCRTLSDPMDCSLPGSSVQGIFQARVLEWGYSKCSLDLMHYVSLSIFIQILACSLQQTSIVGLSENKC